MEVKIQPLILLMFLVMAAKPEGKSTAVKSCGVFDKMFRPFQVRYQPDQSDRKPRMYLVWVDACGTAHKSKSMQLVLICKIAESRNVQHSKKVISSKTLHVR